MGAAYDLSQAPMLGNTDSMVLSTVDLYKTAKDATTLNKFFNHII